MENKQERLCDSDPIMREGEKIRFLVPNPKTICTVYIRQSSLKIT